MPTAGDCRAADIGGELERISSNTVPLSLLAHRQDGHGQLGMHELGEAPLVVG